MVWPIFNVMLSVFLVASCLELEKEDVDKVIEEEITQKLSEDLLQSIERKFQVDLERSIDTVLMKIKLLLQNGTAHIQDRVVELQGLLDAMKRDSEKEVETCLVEKQNDTSALAEKALHQMVVCGYALIGHDPAEAVKKVMQLKDLIKKGLEPVYEQKKEVYNLLKVCGHEHDSLKKVIKCVISKSPLIKTVMMDLTSKLIEGVMGLTKLMAHGAMHEACLIEVIKTAEDEAFELVKQVRSCTYGNNTVVLENVNKYLEDNNATVLEVDDNKTYDNKDEKVNMKDLIRKMLASKNKEDGLNSNVISKDIVNVVDK